MTLAINQSNAGMARINEEMMNPKILQLASLPIQRAGNEPQHLTRPEKAGDAFSPNFREFWLTAQKGMPTRTGNTLDPNTAQKRQISGMLGTFRKGIPNRMGPAFYLDQLREGLLGKGKSLSKISLEQEDLPLLKEFLLHLGFSEEKGEEILKGLAENHPGGEILLSQFIQHIAELGLPEANSLQHLEPSVVPQLESVLRDLGLTPKEVERVFAETRVEGGGLDLAKLVLRLKAFHHEMKVGTGIENRQVAFDRISNQLEKIGLHSPVMDRQGQISLKDFIVSLERMTGARDEGEPLPADIKGTIDRILERASLSKENRASQSSWASLAKVKVDPSAVMDKLSGRDGLLNRAAPFKRKASFAPQAGKENNQAIHGPQKSGSPNPLKGLELLSNVNGDQGSEKGLNWENYKVQAEKATFSVPGQTSGSTFSDAIHATKQNQMPTRDVLPTYLVDQVGKQISRSLQRGDRIIKIQLKPPELGMVKVEMALKDNVLKLGMIIESSAVKELLLANTNELKEALAEQGVKLEKIDVQIGDHSNQTFSDLKEGLKEGQRGNQGDKVGSNDYRADRQAGPSIPFIKDQILDLVA